MTESLGEKSSEILSIIEGKETERIGAIVNDFLNETPENLAKYDVNIKSISLAVNIFVSLENQNFEFFQKLFKQFQYLNFDARKNFVCEQVVKEAFFECLKREKNNLTTEQVEKLFNFNCEKVVLPFDISKRSTLYLMPFIKKFSEEKILKLIDSQSISKIAILTNLEKVSFKLLFKIATNPKINFGEKLYFYSSVHGNLPKLSQEKVDNLLQNDFINKEVINSLLCSTVFSSKIAKKLYLNEQAVDSKIILLSNKSLPSDFRTVEFVKMFSEPQFQKLSENEIKILCASFLIFLSQKWNVRTPELLIDNSPASFGSWNGATSEKNEVSVSKKSVCPFGEISLNFENRLYRSRLCGGNVFAQGLFHEFRHCLQTNLQQEVLPVSNEQKIYSSALEASCFAATNSAQFMVAIWFPFKTDGKSVESVSKEFVTPQKEKHLEKLTGIEKEIFCDISNKITYFSKNNSAYFADFDNTVEKITDIIKNKLTVKEKNNLKFMHSVDDPYYYSLVERDARKFAIRNLDEFARLAFENKFQAYEFKQASQIEMQEEYKNLSYAYNVSLPLMKICVAHFGKTLLCNVKNEKECKDAIQKIERANLYLEKLEKFENRAKKSPTTVGELNERYQNNF
ncbi:MAG: hypothetical protein WCR30_04720 [Clostridia bacterium]